MIKLPPSPQVDIDPLYEITQGLEKGLLLFTAMEYDIFTCLKTPKTAENISAELGIDSKFSIKFLNSLVAIGLLTKKDSLYCNTLLTATYLVKDEPFYQGNLLNLMKKTRQQRWKKLPLVLKSGSGQPNKKFEEAFDKGFILGMAEGALRGGLYDTIKALSQLSEFSKAQRILDLGGGHGLYAIAFAQMNPAIESFVFDLPPVIEVAKEFITKYQMENRVKTITGDFTKDDWGNNYDIIFASDVFYRVREVVLPVLQKIRNTLNKDGLFICKQWTIDETRTSPMTTVLWDLMVSMLGSPSFYTHTNEEFIRVLKEAGFKRIELIDISTPSKPSRIIMARKEDN